MIDENGITIPTLTEIVEVFNIGLKDIYGQDINLDQNTPDGQLVNIFAQANIDILENQVQIYNSFDPDKAIGEQQDRSYKLNGVFRKSSRFTQVAVLLTFDRPVNLQGLDANFDNPDATGYTVSDNEGNQFILINSGSYVAGANLLEFRARQEGAIEVLPNTITNPVTIILGVVSITNPQVEYIRGLSRESDIEFSLRRQRSVSSPSQGTLEGLRAGLLALDNVNDAIVYENVTNSTDSDGIPPHSFWAIIQGGSNDGIGAEIYKRHNQGAGMKGDIIVDVPRINGIGFFTARFDQPEAENLYIRFSLTEINGASLDLPFIKQQLVNRLVFGIYEVATTSSITCILREIVPNAVASNVGVGLDGILYGSFIFPTLKKNIFVADVARIDIT